MNTNDLIAHYGSKAKAIEKLGIYRQLFYNWSRDGIPSDKQSTIQLATRGKLRAGKPKRNGK